MIRGVAFVNARDTPSNYNDLGQSQIVSVGGPTQQDCNLALTTSALVIHRSIQI